MMRFLSILAVCGACGPTHVRLDAPSATLAPDQRVAYFLAMRPTRTTYTTESRDGGDTWRVTDRTLILFNGKTVEAPEDLVPVVGAESVTARAANESVDARRHAKQADVGLFASIVFAAVVVGPLASRLDLVASIGWGLGLMPAAVASVMRWHFTRDEMDARARAFSAYTREMGERLNVCASGIRVVPCESPSTGAPGQLPPAPSTN